MSEVRFVVTGDLEREALAESIGRLFTNDSADFVVARGLCHPFTSTPLREKPSQGVLDSVDKFADRLLREVDEHRDAMIVGIDDLELDNDAGRTVRHVREAVKRRMEYFHSSAKPKVRLARRIASRCSFHLMVPMTEAYFFGEPAALVRAEANKRPSLFDGTCDVEEFLVEDPEYLRYPEVTPETVPNKERRKRSWAKNVDVRRRHPKLYIRFLCSPDDPFGNVYRELRQGATAFKSLAWDQVAHNSAHMKFARAIVADIADFLDVQNPLPGKEHPLTARSASRHMSTLRNL